MRPRTFSADSAAPPGAVWTLLARPDRWHEWSPHVRGAWGLGDPEVREGAVGAVRLLGVLPVPARILAVSAPPPAGSWTWRVGAVTMEHRVRALPGGGSRVSIALDAPGPLGPIVGATYGPVCALLLARLARAAA